MKWYQTAFERGDSGSADRIATIYSEGRLVPQDIDEAVRWWRIEMSQMEDKDFPYAQLKILRAREVQSGKKNPEADHLQEKLFGPKKSLEQLVAKMSEKSSLVPSPSVGSPSSSSNACGWKEVSSDSKNAFFYDPCTVKKQGKYSMLWTMVDYETQQKLVLSKTTLFHSAKSRYAFNCSSDRAAGIGIIRYSNRRGDGETVYSHSYPEDEWRFNDVAPGTILETFARIACKP